MLTPLFLDFISDFLGTLAFWLYAGISLLGFLFILAFVPETRGKTEEEMRLFFTAQKPLKSTEKSSDS